jgi:hypothetical protein
LGRVSGIFEQEADMTSERLLNKAESAAGREDLHQKHVIGGLWVVIALVVLIGGTLIWAEVNGILDNSADHASAPAWSTSWP